MGLQSGGIDSGGDLGDWGALELIHTVLRGPGATMRADPSALTKGISALLANPKWRVFAPLVHLSLGQLAGPGSPASDAAKARLRAEALGSIATGLVRQRIIRSLGARLREAHLSVVLLKGAGLTGSAYPLEAPRLGVDIDLLIRADDADAFADAVAGFALEHDKFPDQPHLARLAYERSFWTVQPLPTELDVHHALCYPALYPIDYDELWSCSTAHPAYGIEALRVPSPEDMLIHLAVHAYHDLEPCSRHDVDAAVVIRSFPLDWRRLGEHALAWGVSTPLFLLLERTAQDLGSEVPGSVLEALRPGPLRRWTAAWALDPRKPEGTLANPRRPRVRQIVSQMVLTGGSRAAIRFQLRYLAARLLDTYAQ